MRRLAALALTAGLAACGPAAAPPPAPEAAKDVPQCPRDAAGQVRCLVEFFAAPACAEAEALGTMHRENAAEATYQTITAYKAPDECRAELAARAQALGFAGEAASGSAPGQVSLELSPNYRQVLTIGPDQLVEWERDKQ